jgi:AcrR family transcriptional regulator
MNDVHDMVNDMRADLRPSLRDALLDAAETTIATRGLNALRARDLADAAGCALGMIYKLFPNLDALILGVNSRTLAMLEPALEASGSLEASDCVIAADRPEVLALSRLALAYFDFAAAHQLRWRALFEHRLAPDGVVPEWHLAEHQRLFGYVERPLRSLLPDARDETLLLLGRSLFSAVHGVVSLGLDEKLVSMPRDVLRRHTGLIAASAARGLALSGTLEICG